MAQMMTVKKAMMKAAELPVALVTEEAKRSKILWGFVWAVGVASTWIFMVIGSFVFKLQTSSKPNTLTAY